eukprot:10060734-Alexandrium_andersonii.AAC.1
MRSAGMSSVGFERDDEATMMDMCNFPEIAHAVHLATQLKWGGGSWHAPVCSCLLYTSPSPRD